MVLFVYTKSSRSLICSIYGDKAITMNKRKGPSHFSAIALDINTDRFISRIILQLQQLRQPSDPYLRL